MEKFSGTLQEYLKARPGIEVKLHLGCGGVRWKDFINVDLFPGDESVNDSSREGCAADVFADIRNLGLDDGSVQEIFTSHTFEHFPKWEGLDMLQDWQRILRPGGRLVIEMPDFWRCIFWLFHPSRAKRRLGRTQFYGNQWDRLDYETHRYVWSSGEISKALRDLHFSSIKITHQTETHYPGRDMRVIAVK